MKTNEKCEAVEPLLTAYHLQELNGEQTADVRAHLATCVPCAAAARDIATTLGLVREALTDTPALQLDFGHRTRALIARPKNAAQKLRELLDLPLTGPIPAELWPAALAKAAIIFIVPLGVALAILAPALRDRTDGIAAHVTNGKNNVPATNTDDAPAYEVDLLIPSEFAARDVLENGNATGDAPLVASSTATLENVAEEFHAASLHNNELPKSDKLGLAKPDSREAAHLASATAPILADVAKARAVAQQQALATLSAESQRKKMASHIKTGGKPRITSTLASPPPPTNRSAILPPSPETK